MEIRINDPQNQRIKPILEEMDSVKDGVIDSKDISKVFETGDMQKVIVFVKQLADMVKMRKYGNVDSAIRTIMSDLNSAQVKRIEETINALKSDTDNDDPIQLASLERLEKYFSNAKKLNARSAIPAAGSGSASESGPTKIAMQTAAIDNVKVNLVHSSETGTVARLRFKKDDIVKVLEGMGLDIDVTAGTKLNRPEFYKLAITALLMKSQDDDRLRLGLGISGAAPLDNKLGREGTDPNETLGANMATLNRGKLLSQGLILMTEGEFTGDFVDVKVSLYAQDPTKGAGSSGIGETASTKLEESLGYFTEFKFKINLDDNDKHRMIFSLAYDKNNVSFQPNVTVGTTIQALGKYKDKTAETWALGMSYVYKNVFEVGGHWLYKTINRPQTVTAQEATAGMLPTSDSDRIQFQQVEFALRYNLLSSEAMKQLTGDSFNKLATAIWLDARAQLNHSKETDPRAININYEVLLQLGLVAKIGKYFEILTGYKLPVVQQWSVEKTTPGLAPIDYNKELPKSPGELYIGIKFSKTL